MTNNFSYEHIIVKLCYLKNRKKNHLISYVRRDKIGPSPTSAISTCCRHNDIAATRAAYPRALTYVDNRGTHFILLHIIHVSPLQSS